LSRRDLETFDLGTAIFQYLSVLGRIAHAAAHWKAAVYYPKLEVWQVD
jgi:hypothetical protein